MKKVSVFDFNKARVESIDLSEPCIVALYGLRSETPEGLAKNLLNKIEFMLHKMDLSANVCGNIHDLYLLNDKFANFINRANSKLFDKGHNPFVFCFQLFVPGFFNRYANDLFNMTLLPRITDKNGKALPVEVAKNNLRKIVFFSHSYGARMVSALDEKLTKKLLELKYSPEQAQDIQKQLVFIEESPIEVFSNLKSTYIRFISLLDGVMAYKKLYDTDNRVTYYEKYNIVSAPKIHESSNSSQSKREHTVWPMVARVSMTEQGRQITNILNQVFYNALTLPRIEGLASLCDFKGLNTKIIQKPMLKKIEKIPTEKAKNLAFISSSLLNGNVKKSKNLSR